MGTRVIWSPEALEDSEAIAEFIARDSRYYASAVISKILATAKDISAFPHIGRIVPETGDATLRERFVYSYRLIYRVRNEEITIVAVVHGKRLLDSMGTRFDSGS